MAENYGVENPLEKVEEEIKDLEERENRLEKEETERSKFNNLIAVTISIYAVLTAIAGLKESQITTESLLEMDNAVLVQAQAADQWTFYDAKSIKNDLNKSLLQLLPALDNKEEVKRVQEEYQKSISKFEQEKDGIQQKAIELEKNRDEKIGRTSELVKLHHNAGFAMVFLQISIVLASVSSILRKKLLWFGSIGVAVVGLIYLFPLLLHN